MGERLPRASLQLTACTASPSRCRYDRATFYTQGEEGECKLRFPACGGCADEVLPPCHRAAACVEALPVWGPSSRPLLMISRSPPPLGLPGYLDYPFLEETEEGKAFLASLAKEKVAA